MSEHNVMQPELKHIPSGPFLMGTSDAQVAWLARRFDLAREWRDKGYFNREQPQHTVWLPDYWMARYPVTVGEYRVFIQAGGYAQPGFWSDAGWAWREQHDITDPRGWDEELWAGGDQLPVVGVSWYEARAYCRWLSEAMGRIYRLPAEAEWEKAARGTGGWLFPWGDEFDAQRCNCRVSGLGHTVPVGRYSPAGDSPYGCAGMAGNVSEWTLSRLRPYPYADHDEPHGDRVIRGGSWHSPLLRVRTAARGHNDPWFSDTDVGFRCVCSSAGSSSPIEE
jgi:formylglycine-generating enzyme required for sulfatase activity